MMLFEVAFALAIYVIGFAVTFHVLADDNLGPWWTLTCSALWFLLWLAAILVIALDVGFCVTVETLKHIMRPVRGRE